MAASRALVSVELTAAQKAVVKAERMAVELDLMMAALKADWKVYKKAVKMVGEKGSRLVEYSAGERED